MVLARGKDDIISQPEKLISTTNRTNPATLPELLSEHSKIQEKIESGTIRYSECQEEGRTEPQTEINERRSRIWGEEWTREERIRRGKEAYEREEI